MSVCACVGMSMHVCVCVCARAHAIVSVVAYLHRTLLSPRHNEDDIDLLFQLLRIYSTRQVISLHFLSRFLESSVIKVNTIATQSVLMNVVLLQNPSLPYKRKIFFKFVEVFQDIHYLQELKAKILQHIILPLFAYSFEEGKVDEVRIFIAVFM